MAISSHAIEIGKTCPQFLLSSVDGKSYSLDSFSKSQALLVAFICNHCPYVQAIEDRLLSLAHSYPSEKLQTVAICSNDWRQYPDDSPENLLKKWRDKKFQFPYLVDEKQ